MTGLNLQDDGMRTSPVSTRPSALRRLATWCYRRRRTVLAAWVVLLIVLSAIAGSAKGEFDNEFGLPGSESQAAFDLMKKSGFGDRAGATVQLVVQSDGGVQQLQ